MKKSSKILLGGGLACLLIGCMIVFTTVIIGGREKIAKMVRDGDFTIRIGRATFFGLNPDIDWDLEDYMLYNWNGFYDYDDDYDMYEDTNETLVDQSGLEDITDIELKIAGGKLKIKQDETRENYGVSIKRTNQYQTIIENGCLIIEPIEPINHVKRGTTITLYMPKDAKLNSFKLEFGGGKADISDLVADEVDIDIGGGELNINKITSRELSCNIGAGALNIKNAVVDDLDMEAAMGKANYAGEINQEADISCSMGTVDLKIDGSDKDFNYDLDCAMGTLNLEGARKTAGIGTERVINNKANKEIEVHCDVGTVAISFR